MPLTIHFSSEQPEENLVARAADIIARDGIAVFPTETVYGVGADSRCPEAMERIFRLKERPRGMPLLAHCSNPGQLDRLVAEIPDRARALIKTFWPGPLALIFKARADLPPLLRAADGTVGIRMVAHPVTQAVIERLGAPLAGTSANLHSRPATAIFSQLDPTFLADVDLVLDAGVCGSGTASTVLDVTCDPPRLVRAGAIPAETLKAALLSTSW